MRREPTEAELNDACLSFRHDFGLLSKADKIKLRQEARGWFEAWNKTYEIDELKDYANAMAEIVKDFLPFCPAKRKKMMEIALEKGRDHVFNVKAERDQLQEELDDMRKQELDWEEERKGLPPCKCGAKNAQLIHRFANNTKWEVYCNSCGLGDSEAYGDTKEEAIEKWIGLQEQETQS